MVRMHRSGSQPTGMGYPARNQTVATSEPDYITEKKLNRNWRIEAGLDLAGAADQVSGFVIQQAYADIAWKFLRLSIGSKERPGFPLTKNERLSSGMMVEGPNARPVPQVRIDIPEYVTIPGTGNWLALKGHLAYGAFTDWNWQEDFAAPETNWGKHILYHSKSLMFRIGNREKFPVEFELGLLMAAQFAGAQMLKNADGSSTVSVDMPGGLKSFFKAFIPMSGGSDTPWGDQVNVEGNHLGSWNFALTYYLNDWRFRAYLDHYFDDHSQWYGNTDGGKTDSWALKLISPKTDGSARLCGNPCRPSNKPGLFSTMILPGHWVIR